MNKKLFLSLVLVISLSTGCATDEAAFHDEPSLAGAAINTMRSDGLKESHLYQQPKTEPIDPPDERSPVIDGPSNKREASGGFETSPFARRRKFYGVVPKEIHSPE